MCGTSAVIHLHNELQNSFLPKKKKRQIGNVSNPLLVSLSALRPPQQHQAPEVGCCAVGRVRHLGTSGSNSSPASRMVNI